MTFDDFCHHYVNVSYCRVVNTSMFSLSKTWHEGLAHSAWKKPNRAGGCINNKDTFLNNPQVNMIDLYSYKHLMHSSTTTGNHERFLLIQTFDAFLNNHW